MTAVVADELLLGHLLVARDGGVVRVGVEHDERVREHLRGENIIIIIIIIMIIIIIILLLLLLS